MRRTLELINLIYDYINDTGKEPPLRVNKFILDNRFTGDYLIDYIKENGLGDGMWVDGMSCYQIIFEEIIQYQDTTKYVNMICESEDIGEEYPYGIYSYYLGYITDEIPFIYHDPYEAFYNFPSRLNIFTSDYEIFIAVNDVNIKVLPIGNRDIFFHSSFDQCLQETKEYLKRTERPYPFNIKKEKIK